MATGGTSPTQLSPDPTYAGIGALSGIAHPIAYGFGGTAPVSQTIYASGIPLRVGQTVTGIALLCEVAAAGTNVTGMYVGLANRTVVLAQSASTVTAASWPRGLMGVPFTAPYVVPVDGYYYGLLLQNGTFGSTQPTFIRGDGATGIWANNVVAAAPLFALGGTGQTVLPANAAAITLTAAATTVIPFGMWSY